MTLTISVERTTISVEPGTLAGCAVMISNKGASARGVELGIDGEAAGWAWVVPDAVTVGPGQHVEARVSVRPPRAGAPASGPMTLTIKAAATDDASAGSAVAELTIDIAPVRDLFVAVSPIRSSGRRSARHTVTVANRGNAPAAYVVTAHDNEGALRFSVKPSELTIGTGGQAVTELGVRPRRMLRFGSSREHPFQVTATAEGGSPATASATMRHEPVLGSRKSKVAAAIVLLVLCLLGLRALGSSSSTAARGVAAPSATTIATDPNCPATGRVDPSLRQPPPLESLPKDYSFLISDDGCRPARFNPCEPIHYVTRADTAPRGFEQNLRASIERVSEATGIRFVDDGPTDEEYAVEATSFRRAFQPDRYGQRWAPILFQWVRFPPAPDNQERAGASTPIEFKGQIVSGFIGLNSDVNDDPVSNRKVIMHELAHVLGLGHTSSPSSLMLPTVRADDPRPAKFTAGDRTGLRILGRQSGCLDVPPLPDELH